MPELPEVETMCRGIAAIVGRTIAGMGAPRSKLRPIKILPPLGRFRGRVEGGRDRLAKAWDPNGSPARAFEPMKELVMKAATLASNPAPPKVQPPGR